MMPGKRILLAVSAGIAAFKVVSLASLLTKRGDSVRVIMTPKSCRFVGPASFQGVTREKVYFGEEQFDGDGIALHISLAKWAEVTIVAPATADLIGRMASGLGDDIVTTTLLCVQGRRIIVPAMNTLLWQNPLVQRNVALLQSTGWDLAGPVTGTLAEGESGQGRMLEPEQIADLLSPVP